MQSMYKLSSHCCYVKGTSGAAIYDLYNGTVFSLNADGREIIDRALRGEDVGKYGSFMHDLCDRSLFNCTQYGQLSDIAKPEPSLRYVWLELTSRCNCHCLHCYGAFGSPDREQIDQELSIAEWKDILNTVRKMGCSAIQFIGGEPLLHPDFDELLSYAYNIGINSIDIFTNGCFLSSNTAQLIKKAGASVRVSLYGYDVTSHENITQCKGSFAALDKSLDLLRELHIPTRIAVVLMRENQEALKKIIAYIEAKGHRYSGCDTVRKVRHSAQNSHAVTDPDILQLRNMLKPNFVTSVEDFSCNKFWNSCWYGKFAVTSCGDILPCIFARDLRCGNVRHDAQTMIRDKLLGYWEITKDKIDVCKECEFRYACDDCRPLAMGECADIWGKYPRCFYYPGSCEWAPAHP